MIFNRKMIGMVMIIVMILSMLIPMGFAEEVKDEKPKYEDAFVIVQFEPNIKAEDKAKHKEELGLSIKTKFKKKGLELLKINGNKSVEEVVEKLSKKKGVVFAEPDYLVYPTYTPDDTYYYLMWGLEQSNDIDIDAEAAWDISRGEEVVVAVIDTSVDESHPDLIDKFIDGADFLSDGRTRNEGHGTHVSGTIGAVDNDIGVIGVAPSVKIMPLGFIGDKNGETYGSTSDAISAIEHATDSPLDVKIINASWGGGGFSDALYDAINEFGVKGGIFIAAAGNDGMNTDIISHYPSSYDLPNIISVAAVNSKGRKANFSNYGVDTVDLGAPGEKIASTYLGSYYYMDGTSMATPHVSGVAALMLAKNADLSFDALKGYILDNVVSLRTLKGQTVTGGMLNAKLALDAVPDQGTEPSNEPPTIDITSPNDGETVVGTISITANVWDDDTVNQPSVEFFVNDSSVGNVLNSPYEIEWDSANLPDGDVKISATVTDFEGVTVDSNDVNIIVDNVDDPPQVNISNPSDGESVSGQVNITVDASDDQGDPSVKIEINNILKTTLSGPVYEYAWDTTSEADANYEIKVTADDGVNQPVMTIIGVTVNNSTAYIVDSVSYETIFTAGGNKAYGIGTVNIAPAASGIEVVVEWYFEGSAVGGETIANTDSEGIATFTSDTVKKPKNGLFTIEVVSIDGNPIQ